MVVVFVVGWVLGGVLGTHDLLLVVWGVAVDVY